MTDREKKTLKDGVISIFDKFNLHDHTATIGGLRNDILKFINSMQEEPVSSIWHDASEKSNEPEDVVIINPSDNTGDVLTRCVNVYQGCIWAYTSVLLKLDKTCNIGKNLQEPQVKKSAETQHVNETCKNSGNSLTQEHVNKDFEMALAEMIDKAQKCVVEPLVVAAQWKDELIKLAKCEEPVSEEFEEALAREWQGYNDRGAATVDALEDNTQELAFAKGFYRGAKWQKENLWKPADGDDLPEIDREIIALLANGKVVFAHRLPEYWDGKDIMTGKVTRYYPKRYDKGGWNIPDVKYWLDVKLPKEIEL